jgi:ABC-type Zn uptake system ZnuABC Zn-binding protein ZnuA
MMFAKNKIFSIIIILILIVFSTIAAQCGAPPAQEAAQAEAQPTTQAEEAEEHKETEEKQEDEHQEEEEHEHEEDAHEHEEDEHAADAEAVFENLGPISLGAGEKLKVVATTNIIGDMIRSVAGDTVELTILLPLGVDPHTFSPTPADVAAVAQAHVVFVNGLNLEEYLTELVENAGGQAVVIPVSAGVQTRQFEAMAEHDQAEEEDHDEEHHHHEGADPHIWTTPANGMVMVHNIERGLSAVDPANVETYEAQAEDYEAALEELDQWIKAQVETIPAENRKLVTDHESLGYYADRYGFEVIGVVLGFSTNAEPSAQELAELQEAIGEYKAKAVFVGTTVSPTLAQRVAEDTGIQLVPLYSDSLGAAGSGAETYLDYLHYNTNVIAEALK